jgi:hypothetical protein
LLLNDSVKLFYIIDAYLFSLQFIYSIFLAALPTKFFWFRHCSRALGEHPISLHTLAWWKSSPNGMKWNVDCVIFLMEGRFGIWICFRDSLGHLVEAHTMIFLFISNGAMWSYGHTKSVGEFSKYIWKVATANLKFKFEFW